MIPKESVPEGPHENEVHGGLIELPLRWGGIAVVDRTKTQIDYCVDIDSDGELMDGCELMFTINECTRLEHVEYCAGRTVRLLLGLPTGDEGEEVSP